MSENVVVHGWKFLNPYGATEGYSVAGKECIGAETVYPLPGPNDKWGPWFAHPNPADYDGNACGAGRWHVMKNLSAKYAPPNWWVWFAECVGVVGDDHEKVSCTTVRLRRVHKRTFWRIIRLGWCKEAYLRGADLRGADLSGADLRGADLRGAYLRGAYLRGADLRGADLSGADLSGAYLLVADLRGADLRGADLSGADLSVAYLRGADLRGAIGIDKSFV